MSVHDPEFPERYISRSGVVWSSRQVERTAWEYSTRVDLASDSVTIAGTPYYPVVRSSPFTVEFTTNGNEEQEVATTIKQVDMEGSGGFEEGTPELQMTFISPSGAETRVIQTEEIQTVSPTDAVPEHFPITGGTQQACAVQLEKYAALHPEAVDPAHVITLLGSSDAKTVRASVAALRYVVDDRGEECISAIHLLHRHLQDSEKAVARDALYCLSRLAKVSPEDAAFTAPEIVPYLTHESQACRENALTACAAIASVDADMITGEEETLVRLLTDGSRTERVLAAKTITGIATGSPERVYPHISQLIERLSGPGRFEEKIAVLGAIGELATDTPTWIIEYTDDIAACLNSDNEELWGNAATTLYDLTGTKKKND